MIDAALAANLFHGIVLHRHQWAGQRRRSTMQTVGYGHTREGALSAETATRPAPPTLDGGLSRLLGVKANALEQLMRLRAANAVLGGAEPAKPSDVFESTTDGSAISQLHRDASDLHETICAIGMEVNRLIDMIGNRTTPPPTNERMYRGGE